MITYKLVWDDFCSTFLEIVKPKFGEKISQKTISEINSSYLIKFYPFYIHLCLLYHLRFKVKSIHKNQNLEWPKSRNADNKIIGNFESC